MSALNCTETIIGGGFSFTEAEAICNGAVTRLDFDVNSFYFIMITAFVCDKHCLLLPVFGST